MIDSINPKQILNITKSKDFILEKYETVPINEVSRKIIKTDKITLSDYQENKLDLWTFPNINHTLIQKIISDNKLKLSFDFDYLYFDIEAVSTDNNFAKYDNPNAFITSIQFIHNGNKFIYTLNLYQYLFKTQSDISYKYFQSCQDLSSAFINYLRNLNKYTLILGFSSNSDMERNQSFVNNQKSFGYDLPFILN